LISENTAADRHADVQLTSEMGTARLRLGRSPSISPTS